PGRGGDLEQRRKRRLEPEVVEDRDDVEPGVVGGQGEGGVLADLLVRLQRETELARLCHVSSSVGRTRCPIRSIRMITRSSGSGQGTSESRSSQSDSGSRRCFAGSSGRTLWRA